MKKIWRKMELDKNLECISFVFIIVKVVDSWGRDENVSPETSTVHRQPDWGFLLVDVDQ